MRMLSFALSHYLWLGALSLLAYLFGRRATLAFRYHSTLERISFSLAIGLGLISYLVFLSGMFGLLRRPSIFALLAAGLILCHRLWMPRLRWLAMPRLLLQPGKITQMIRRIPRKTAICSLLLVPAVAVYALPILLLPLYPPTAFDATMYHLPYAKVFVEQGGLVFTPHLRYAVFPQTNEMLFTLALLFVDDILAQLVELLMLVILALALAAGSARFWSATSGAWAGALLLGVPLVVWLGTVAYVDIGLTLYTTLGVYAYFIYRREREARWLALSGIICGLALGMKYLALPVVAMLGLAALIAGRRQRDWRGPLLFVLLATLVAAPWMVRNYYYTGNPVFPVLHRQIGSRIGGSKWNDVYTQEIFEDFSRKWEGKGIDTLLQIPSRLAYPFTGGAVERYSAYCLLLLIFLLPALLIAARRDQTILSLLLFGGGHFLFWLFLTIDIRFLIPSIPLFCLALAGSLELVWKRLAHRLQPRSQFVSATLLAMLLAFPGWYSATTQVRAQGRIPVTAEQRARYLTRILPPYPIYRSLNERYGSDYTLYAIAAENMVYYAEGAVYGDYFGPMSYRRLGLRTDVGESLPIIARTFHPLLKRNGIDHLLISAVDYQALVSDAAEFARYFKLVDQANGWMLFALN